ncbi:MAG: DUF368 domain-containing protein [Phycisphaerales bacterium]
MDTVNRLESTRLSMLTIRGAFGGVLMGLANLVPGISGGTMLLVAGVYPAFVGAIAELTRLRFRLRPFLLLGVVALAAGLTIILLARAVMNLVIDHRWIMYSLFIGLTLGGAPLLLKMMKPRPISAWVGVAAGILVMVAIALVKPGAANDPSGNMFVLFLAGVAGASAMILPGVSGAYLLLILGQYVTILAALHEVKAGLLGADGAGPDLSVLLGAMPVVIPVGIGVVLGIVAVSSLLSALLQRFEKPTLGFLLGLLLGSIVGLWPFQQAVEPPIGSVYRGEVVDAQILAEIERKDWPNEYFRPTPVQVATSVGLIAVGFAVTLGVARIGREKPVKRQSV